jgi:hypothetical protein
MTVNLSQWITHGGEHTFYGTFASDEVTFNGSSSVDLTAADESHMAKMIGIVNLPITVPGAESLDFDGDNGIVGTMILKPVGSVTAEAIARVEDQAFGALAQKAVINADGDYDERAYSNVGLAFRPMCMVINSPAQSQESASKPAGGWDVTELLFFEAHDLSGMNIQSRTARDFNRNFVLSERSKRIDGSTITTVKYGVTQAYVIRYWSPNPVMYGAYVGDAGVGQTFTVPYALSGASAEELQIVKDGTSLVYTTDYTVVASTGVVTFTVAGDPASGEVCVYRAQISETALQ